MTMADRIVIMKDGHIQQVGTPAEVYHKKVNTFVAGFIRAPSMNMLSGSVSQGRLRLGSGTTLDLVLDMAEGQEVIAKEDGRTPPEVGQEVTLTTAVKTLHIFDAATGDALR